MTGGTLSGGVVIALAATLWLAYLVPTWLRRRDYLNAERNAVRLQQTLRILAETAEAPHEVHVEATARDVARQQKLLKKMRAKADAAARAQAAAEARALARAEAERDAHLPAISATDAEADPHAGVDAARPSRPRTHSEASARAERDRAFAHAVRRTRLATTGAVVGSLIGVGFGIHSLLTAGSWWLLVASGALFLCAILVQRRLAQQVAAHRAAGRDRMPVARRNPELYDHASHVESDQETAPEPAVSIGWDPRPLPKPMYQSPGSRAAAAMASLDAAVALRRAAARAELEERAARIAAERIPTLPARPARVAPELPVSEPVAARAATVQAATAQAATVQAAASRDTQQARASAPASKYARMGMLDDVQSEHIDLDEALRRRRAAG